MTSKIPLNAQLYLIHKKQILQNIFQFSKKILTNLFFNIKKNIFEHSKLF